MCTLLKNPQKKCALLKNDLKESAQISTSTPECARALCARECTPRPADDFAVVASMIPGDVTAKTNAIFDAVNEDFLPKEADWTFKRIRKDVKDIMKIIVL